MCRSGCWLILRVVREPGVATVGQSIIASRTWTAWYLAGASSSVMAAWSLVSGELVTKTEPCLSVTDQVEGRRDRG